MPTTSKMPRTALAGALAALLLAAIAFFVFYPSRYAPPAPAFNLARAMADVRTLAAAPRPIGSAANAAARAHIVGQLHQMGLVPAVQEAVAQASSMDRRRNLRITLGKARNVVVLIPGAAPDHARRPALLMATSYDSSERSLGAGASAGPAAAMLEALRMLKTTAPPANDIVVLFADGEKMGGLGSRAFVDSHPLARRIGLVLRFDGAGSEGAPVLVGASGDNGAAIRGWARAASEAKVPAHGAAALQEWYGSLAGLRMGDLARIGSARLHLANVEGSNGSGLASRDTVERLAPDTVASMGRTMHAMAREFGDAHLPAAHAGASADAGPWLYFDIPFAGVVAYRLADVWMFTRLACLLLLMVGLLAVHRGDVTPREIVDAALGFVAIGALLVLAASLVWYLLPSLHRGYDAHNQGAGAHDAWFLGGFAALGTALFVLLQRGFRRAVGHAAAALGPVTAVTIVLVVLSWQMPETSYVLAWPLIGTLLAYAVLYAPQRMSGIRRAAVLAAGAVPALLVCGPLLRELATISSPERSELPMIVLALALGMGSVLLTAQRRFIVRGLGAAAIACFAVAGTAAPYGPKPLPQPNRMVYLKDAATWKAYWMMPEGPLDAWARPFFGGATRARVHPDAFGWNSPAMWLAPAPRTDIAFPAIASVSDVDDGTLRHLRFRLEAKREVPFIDLTLSGTDAFSSSVNGRSLSSGRTASYTLALYGMGGQTLDFSFDVESDKRAEIDINERTPGLPAHAAPARPDHLPPPLTPMTATTIARDRLVFR